MPYPILPRSGVGMMVLVPLAYALTAPPAVGQSVPGGEPPARVAPAGPKSKKDRDRLEARRLYGVGVLRQREDQVIDALSLFEEARKLDPESVTVCKALVPLYMALGRSDEAMKTCAAILDLSPDDVDTRYLLGRQLKDAGRTEEAVTALEQAAASPALEGRPELKLYVSFHLGSLYEEAKQYTKAAAAYGRVVAILERPDRLGDGDDAPKELRPQQLANTYERIGTVSLLDKRYDQAVQAFRAAQRKDPANAERLHFNLAQVAIARDRWADALGHLTAYLRTQPTGSEAYTVWATVMEKLGRQEEVVDQLQQFADADRHNGPLRLLLANRLADDGRSADAAREYRRLIETEPTYATEAYRGLFTLFARNGKPHLILEEFNKAVEAAENTDAPDAQRDDAAAQARPMVAVLRDSPNLVREALRAARAEIQRGRPVGAARYYLAEFAKRTSQLDLAETLFRECLANLKRTHDAEGVEATVYTGLLEVLQKQKRYRDAIAVCRRGLDGAVATNRILLHRYLALGHAELGEFKEALAEADEVVTLANDEHRLVARLQRVFLKAQADRTDAAIAEAEEMLGETTDAQSVERIRMTLSNVYSLAHDLPKSERQLQLVLKDRPDNATGNNDLGYLWADQGKNLEEAERLIRKAIELDREQKRASGRKEHGIGVDDDKDNAAYLDSLAWVLFRRGHLTEAREWLEKATALGEEGEDPVIFDHLGDVYYRLQDTDRARAVWGKSVALYEAKKRAKPDPRYLAVKHKLELVIGH